MAESQQEDIIPNLIQQLEMMQNPHQISFQISQEQQLNGGNISSNSSLENNIDPFENRRRINYQDQIQLSQNSNSYRSSSRSRSQQNQINQTQSQLNSSSAQINANLSGVSHQNSISEIRRDVERRSRSSSSYRREYLQQILQQQKNAQRGFCRKTLDFFFNYSLWLYLACNLIVIVNQFVNKSNRNFTLIFWTVTSILFILIRLIQTCMMYQRESEDFTNLMRLPPSTRTRSRISRRNRLNRLYPNHNDMQIPISQILRQMHQQQQLQQDNHDIENQNNSMNPIQITNMNFSQNSESAGVDAQIQQIWLESFRRQMNQEGVNSNVLILQQRLPQQQQVVKGLSKDEIKKLEKVAYTQEELDNLQEQDILCSICLEKYECDRKLIKLPCSHTYHNYCITKWLLQDHKCPLCRQDLRITQ